MEGSTPGAVVGVAGEGGGLVGGVIVGALVVGVGGDMTGDPVEEGGVGVAAGARVVT